MVTGYSGLVGVGRGWSGLVRVGLGCSGWSEVVWEAQDNKVSAFTVPVVQNVAGNLMSLVLRTQLSRQICKFPIDDPTKDGLFPVIY